jgi:hypothetical protein
LLKQFVLQRLRSLVRSEDFIFHLFQFRGEEALAIGHRLFALPGARHVPEIRRRHLDKVTED